MVYTKGPKLLAQEALPRRSMFATAEPRIKSISPATKLDMYLGEPEPIDEAEFVEVERDGVKTGIAAAKREPVSGLSKAINGLEAAEKRHVHIIAKGKAGGKRIAQRPVKGGALAVKYDSIFANLKAKIDAIPAASPKAEAKRIAKGGSAGTLIALRLQPDLIARLDHDRGGGVGRQEFIRALLEDTLSKPQSKE